MQCRICASGYLEIFLSLGESPLANSFLKKEQLGQKENFFPLELCFCNNCKLVQLTYAVDPEIMFKNYVYASSTSNTFKAHFSRMAENISKSFMLNENSFVADIGSNDGILLKAFKKFNVKTIGVEPAANIAKIAQENGVDTINGFFDENSVKEIINKKGKTDVVSACNVFAHVEDVLGFTQNVKNLLKEHGVFVIEVQYLIDTIDKVTFDNIYHEHIYYYSLTSLINFFISQGMEVFDVERVATHGGSLRVFIQKKSGKYTVNNNVKELLEYEKNAGIGSIEIYKNFANKVYRAKKNLVSYIKDIKKQGKNIAGYGAPAKSTTLLNFCNLGKGYIDYIIDDNPLKIGLYTPGTNIPVVGLEILEEKSPDYVLILAWNFAEEILAKTKKYSDLGVKFVIPLPEPKIA